MFLFFGGSRVSPCCALVGITAAIYFAIIFNFSNIIFRFLGKRIRHLFFQIESRCAKNRCRNKSIRNLSESQKIQISIQNFKRLNKTPDTPTMLNYFYNNLSFSQFLDLSSISRIIAHLRARAFILRSLSVAINLISTSFCKSVRNKRMF